MTSPSPWHFPRTDTADAIMRQFTSGITSAITLFAPRRMGKTELLLQDLAPTAEALGYTVVYVSLWENKMDPLAALLEAFSTKALLDGTEFEIEVNAGIVTGKAKKEFQPEAPDKQSIAVSRAFRSLVSKKAPVLLLLDEVQHLATRREFEPIIAQLRTLLDENKTRINTVFTGSSRDALLSMFRSRKAPLFNSAQQIDLPALGDEFVRHMVNTFNAFSVNKIDYVQAVVAFRKMHLIPASFHGLLVKMMPAGRADILNAVNEYIASENSDSNHEEQWKSLKLIDRLLLSHLAQGASGGLFNEEFKREIASELGVDDVPNHTIQNAVNRLRTDGIISGIGRGTYAIDDPRFAEWITDNGA